MLDAIDLRAFLRVCSFADARVSLAFVTA